jgi:hypothetical protein
MGEHVGRMTHRPDKVEMEFRASLSGECDLWIMSGEGEAEFKVTLARARATRLVVSREKRRPLMPLMLPFWLRSAPSL